MAIKSRWMLQIEDAIKIAPSAPEAACLRVQRAMLLVRQGQLGAAREALTSMHQLAFQHVLPELSAWLHLAEGLVAYYTDFSSGNAYDEVQRAHQIAADIEHVEVESLASAWLADFSYVRLDLAAMIRHAQDCLRLAPSEHHAARTRLCMVLAAAHDYAGGHAHAQAWYGAARRHATELGDDVSLSALMYNMAEMRTAQARHAELTQAVHHQAPLLLGADSVRHFDAAIGGSAMSELTALLRAQVLTLQREFAQARMLYETHLPSAMSGGLARLGSSYLSELAWCCVNTGEADLARQHARKAEFELGPNCHTDDRAATHSRLAQVHEALNQRPQAELHTERAAAAWIDFERQQAEWREALSRAALLL